MGRAYKNFWSLNTDEAVVTGILRDAVGKKNGEIFMPMNAQMKDVDLALVNLKTKKVITIQVKGSKAFEPRKSEVKKYGDGSAGFFFFSADTINEATADYFIFLIYVIEYVGEKGRMYIKPHTIIIPTNVLKIKVKGYPIDRVGRHKLLIWVNPNAKKAFDVRGYEDSDFSENLDENGLEVLKSDLQKI